MAGLAKKHGFAYTRYADDLSFAGELSREAANKIRITVNRIVQEEGFQVNADKTRFMGRGTRQTVTGVVVNQILGLSLQERRRLRAMAHQLGMASGDDQAQAAWQARLDGKIAYLSMLNPQQAARVRSSSLARRRNFDCG